jgi:hypothetical protein
MRRRLITVGLIWACGIAVAFWYFGPVVESDDRPSFSIDPNEPYQIELGRGGGREGLETVRITQDGRVALCREKRQQDRDRFVTLWETATIQLPPNALASVLDTVERHSLMRLHRSYSDRFIADGTQWVLWIKQGAKEKSVYFNNSFPPAIREFARDLDAIIAANSGGVTWQPSTVRQDEELWESIRR